VDVKSNSLSERRSDDIDALIAERRAQRTGMAGTPSISSSAGPANYMAAPRQVVEWEELRRAARRESIVR
jgi:hypothetical protein